jgi:ATP-dependent Clp protease ATP-binding subunit ClpA
VVLFDEIEKAHPRILDKFLQILEDGRLTDGRGETVYFSEAILIFTSNLGIYIENDSGRRVQNVQQGEPYDEVERKVRQGIEDHFKHVLNRPEILNRFGDNVVIFNFISPAVAQDIFNGMLHNIVRRVASEHHLTLHIPDPIRTKLLDLCVRDLSNGGRGIGNRLETMFINPLARALFDLPLERQSEVTVSDLAMADAVCTVTLT